LTTKTVSMRTSSSLWWWKDIGIFPSLILTFIINLMDHWATQSTISPLTLTLVSVPTPTTTLATNRLYFPHQCTGTEPFVTKEGILVSFGIRSFYVLTGMENFD
jgi:hypothetical protein